ncbi:hypothetical protein LPW11_19470 [Geomonas sp. RF6]|uniref:hypothetical protein n=1 Tax=Geomonas sp. RF6 TaxID=2897342 RepID=UPI001E2EB6D6|nr:hypothetical protein [Geomonas sp. RF6]UFS70047.1 hypothetical protein LPW11_19470 [Geomonas sp. RF6]
MNKAAHEITLANGITVRFTHKARRYFGDYHQVRLEVRCDVAVTPEMFADEASFKDAVAKIGSVVAYQRVEEQMGVPTAGVEECVQKLVESFSATALRYFETAEFPKRLVHSELGKALRPRRHLMPMLSNA